ncbi:MAG TPA: CDP-diacylglycerol--glycerol-3-phosphate 3-phosphatidyltransferase [Myxococcota bacterium]|nr:CDP-diacylglycerol--glycerol-3-phosphate 3-phosphatidyltransferase [Myxococcota bacterium]
MQISAEKTANLSRDMAESLWNLPNFITMVRIGLSPFLFALPWYHGRWWSTLIGLAFLVVSLTDILDGYLARSYGLESRLGKLLDPLADKLLVMTAFVMLIAVGRMPFWSLPLVVAILGRELAVSGLRGAASSQGVVIAASPLGKWKTGFQIAALTALLIHWPLLGLPAHEIGLALLVIATALTLISGWAYLRDYLRGDVAGPPA